MSRVTGTHALSSARIRCTLRTVVLCVTRVCSKGSGMRTCRRSTLLRTPARAVCVTWALLGAVLSAVLRFGAGSPSLCRDSAVRSAEVSVCVSIKHYRKEDFSFSWVVYWLLSCFVWLYSVRWTRSGIFGWSEFDPAHWSLLYMHLCGETYQHLTLVSVIWYHHYLFIERNFDSTF